MKRLTVLFLIMALLLTGCAMGDNPNETETPVVYDWMAGESLIPQRRTGLNRQGISTASRFESTAEGSYFIYRGISNGITWLLYGDNGSDSIIKLCGRADCPHVDSDCNAYLGSANCICFYDGAIYFSTGGAGAPRLVRMNPDGTDRVTVMNSSSALAEYGYSGSTRHMLWDGVYSFLMTKLNEDGETIAEGWYYKLDGSTDTVAALNGGVPCYSGGDWFIHRTTAQNGGAYGGYEAWDPDTNTTTYLTDHSGQPGYYGTEEAYYFRDGTVWRLDYATQQESVLFETGLTGDYKLNCYPDCIVIGSNETGESADRNLYIYNWAFELVDTVELDYPSLLCANLSIVGENEERIILTDFVKALPRYYIEKSELGTGNVKIHEYNLPDLEAELAMIDEQIGWKEEDEEDFG